MNHYRKFTLDWQKLQNKHRQLAAQMKAEKVALHKGFLKAMKAETRIKRA